MNLPKHSKNHQFNRNFAIIIGINEYVNQQNLKAAANDAKRLAVFLGNEERKEQRGGNEWYQVLLLTDKAATHEKITEVLKNLEEGKIDFPGQTIKYHNKGKNKDETIEVEKKIVKFQKDDRLLVYFAGHGRLSESKSKDEIQALQLVSQDNIDFSAKELQDTLKKVICQHKLLILDCCYSGAARESSQKQQPLYRVPDVGKKTYHEDFRWLQNPTFTVITSGGYAPVPDGGELNPEHSPFSEALLEALKNDYSHNTVDSNNDHILTVVEIYNYIVGDNRVKQKQHPEIIHITSRETTSGQYFFLLPEFDPSNLISIGTFDKPYKGLFAYEKEDKPIFCGRDELVNQLLERVHVNKVNQKLTIVTGASGSGKSSLVKAGLIPLLKDNSNTSPTASKPSNESNQTKQWTILESMRPGESPLTALAKTILPIYDKDLLDEINYQLPLLAPNTKDIPPNKKLSIIIDHFDDLQNKENLEELKSKTEEKLSKLIQELNKGEDAPQSQQQHNKLIELINSWRTKSNNHNFYILLFIDQFEELITLSQTQEKEVFLNLIVQLIKETEYLHIVLTVRSDFEIYFRGSSKTSDSSNSISQYWNADTRLVVEEMNSEQLRKAIMIPARRFTDKNKRMLGFESEELVSNIIDDVRGMPGGLALLSFTLDELYELASKDTDEHKIIIKRKNYDELDRVSGALTKRATEAYDELGKFQKSDSLESVDVLNIFAFLFLVKEVSQIYKNTNLQKRNTASRLYQIASLLIQVSSAGKIRQAMMKHLILRMVTTQSGKLAKRPVPQSELKYPNWHCRYKDANNRMEEVINKLIEYRLIVRYASEYQNETIVFIEPAHDALILYWDKLHKKNDKKNNTEQQEEPNNQIQEQGWLKEEEGNLVLRDRLIAAIQDRKKWEEEQLQKRKQEPKKIQLGFLKNFKYKKQVVDWFKILVNWIKKIGDFIDYTIEFEMRFKLGKKLKKIFMKVTQFLLRLTSFFFGIILIIFYLGFIIGGIGSLSNNPPILIIVVGFFIFLLGLLIFLPGLLLIAFAFNGLNFLIRSIWNLITRCCRLFKKR